MARLTLSLLGPFRVTLDNQLINHFAYDKVRALLAYLAVESDTAHARDVLAGLFWPELPNAAARMNLRQALTTLRQALNDLTAQPPVLLITRETIQFNVACDHEMDVTTFQTLRAACAAHPHRRADTCSSCARRRAEALDLYRGDFLSHMFLADSAGFEEWAALTRERLHAQARAALAGLTAYHERRAAYDEAQRSARRLVELEPWNEDAHQQLMRALWLGGQRSAALIHFQRCCQLLQAELGMEPAPETTALYERIRDSPSRTSETQQLEAPPARPGYDLPAATTPLLGRDAELAQLTDLLDLRDCRLLTLVGPGGVGKTHLALHVAREHAGMFRHGCCFVSLAATRSPELLGQAISERVHALFGVSEATTVDLRDLLRGKELLLILDSIEHLHTGAQVLTRIVESASNVTLLVTSRMRLHLQGEWVVQLAGLSYPPAAQADGIASFSAVQLFLHGVQRTRGTFVLSPDESASIGRICRLLDGLPLAIELAAAWTSTLSAAEIVRELELGIDLLHHPVQTLPERHHSIRTVLASSWALLRLEEQRMLRALAVFRGGFRRSEAEAVAGVSLDHLSALVDKSLVRRQGDGRFDLHDLVRHYADEQLHHAGEADQIHYLHLQCFVALAERVHPHLYEAERRLWQQQLEQAYANVRVALSWIAHTGVAWSPPSAHGSDEQGDPSPAQLGVRLAAALCRFWSLSVRWQEGREWLRAILPLATDATTPQVRATLLTGAGVLANRQGDHRQAYTLLEAGLALSRECEDRAGIAYALQALSVSAAEQGHYDRAAAMLAEALDYYRAQGNRWWIAQMLYRLAALADDQGDSERAIPLVEESLVIYRAIGDRIEIATVLNILGLALATKGDLHAAAEQFEESIALYEAEAGRAACAWPLGNLAAVVLAQDQAERAMTLYQESLSLRWSQRNIGGCAWCLEGLAAATAMLGWPKRAARLWGAAEVLRTGSGVVLSVQQQAQHVYYGGLARAHVDPTIFDAAWTAGAEMPLEEMIAFGLVQPGDFET